MKRTLIKLFSLILSIVISFSLLAGCVSRESTNSQQSSVGSNTNTETQTTNKETNVNNEAASKTGMPIVEKPITLTYWVNMGSNSAAVISSYNDMEMYKEMEKISNIRIEFKHPPVGQASEQFNLMIASRDLPDLIEYGWLNGYPGGPEKAIGDNIIIKLNDLIDQYAPNLKAILTSDENVNRQARTDEGTLYCFPAIGTGYVKTTGGPLIRKDWLDKLGLQPPETIEEWTTVLTKFKEELGAEAPITGTVSDFISNYWISGAFGVRPGYYIDNGKVKYGPIEPAFREYVELLRNWYKNGLLDPDFSANNSKAVEARVTSGQSGLLRGGIGGSMGTYLNTMKDKDPNFNLIAVQYPVLNKGEVPYFVERAWEVRTSGMLAITTANKYPKESTRWADYFYSAEGNLLKNFGIEGLTYNLVDGYPKYTDLILNNPEGLSVAHALGKNVRASEPSPGLIDSRYHEQYFALPQQQEAFKLWAQVSDNALKVLLPPITPTQEEADEFATNASNIDSYYSEMIVKFIMGIEPMENYEAFVNQLKKMNVERNIEIYQAALERYYNR